MRASFFAASLLAGVVAAGAAHAQELGDPEKGAEVFKKCMPCHKVGPGRPDRRRPVLNGIIRRQIGKESGVVWDVETLTAYLRAPREFIPRPRYPFPD